VKYIILEEIKYGIAKRLIFILEEKGFFEQQTSSDANGADSYKKLR
jgi:hypothetical protein